MKAAREKSAPEETPGANGIRLEDLPVDFKLIVNRELLACLMPLLGLRLIHTQESLANGDHLYYLTKADPQTPLASFQLGTLRVGSIDIRIRHEIG